MLNFRSRDVKRYIHFSLRKPLVVIEYVDIQVENFERVCDLYVRTPRWGSHDLMREDAYHIYCTLDVHIHHRITCFVLLLSTMFSATILVLDDFGVIIHWIVFLCIFQTFSEHLSMNSWQLVPFCPHSWSRPQNPPKKKIRQGKGCGTPSGEGDRRRRYFLGGC